MYFMYYSSSYCCCAGKMCVSSTRAGGNGLNTMLPCPVNLNPKCLCLCALCDSRAALPEQLLMAHAENLEWGNHLRDFVQVYGGGGADPQWEISSYLSPILLDVCLLPGAGPSQPSASSGRGFLCINLLTDICHPPLSQLHDAKNASVPPCSCWEHL